MKFYYVYILQSEIDQGRFYTGFTEDLDARLKTHNSGGCDHTSKHKPWRIKTAIAFTSRRKAIAFEKYLKTPSGRAFAKRDSKILRHPRPQGFFDLLKIRIPDGFRRCSCGERNL